MSFIRELAYRAKLVLLSIYGPAELDEEHDPVSQLKRDRDEERVEEKFAEGEVAEGLAAEWESPAAGFDAPESKGESADWALPEERLTPPVAEPGAETGTGDWRNQ